MERPASSLAPVERDAAAPRAPRLTTILMTGRLVSGTADYLCRIRNVSTGGMMIECDAPLPVGAAVRVELRNLNTVEARVVWSQHPRLGLAFVTDHEVSVLLHVPVDLARRKPRSPRLSASCPVLLWHSGHVSPALLADLSQSGCRLRGTAALPPDAPVRISIPGLPPRHATLRWHRGEEAGFGFGEIMSFADLSAWQRDPAARFATG